MPFLGEIPLLLDIRTNADAGTPIAAAAPDGVAGQAYAALAAQVWRSVQGPVAAAPRIVFD